jgi:malate permease and related proteins
MLSALLLVSLMFIAGSLFTRFGVFSDAGADVINRFVVYVSLPALVLHVVPKLHWQPELTLLVIVPWVTLAIAALAVTLLARAYAWPRGVLGALLLCAPLGNTSFLGAPLVAALRGDGAVQYALLYDQLGSFLALSTYGLFVIARFSGDTSPTLAIMAKRVATFPPFIALVLAFALPTLPEALDVVLKRIGDTLSPLAMFAVGMRMRLRLPAARSALAYGLSVKMLLVPLCALALVRALAQPGIVAEVAVLEASMPPMLSAAALASMAGLDPELCAALAGYGIVIAFVLVPLLAAALTM